MRKKILFAVMTVATFLAQIGIAAACCTHAHQPKVPESLLK